jgi:hypothetical protein
LEVSAGSISLLLAIRRFLIFQIKQKHSFRNGTKTGELNQLPLKYNMHEYEFKMIQKAIFKKIDREILPLLEQWQIQTGNGRLLESKMDIQIKTNELKEAYKKSSDKFPWVDFYPPVYIDTRPARFKKVLRVKDEYDWNIYCYSLAVDLTQINKVALNNHGIITMIDSIETTSKNLINSLNELEEFGLTLSVI